MMKWRIAKGLGRASTSPTQLSLRLLRDQGMTAQVVERWCPHSRRRIDLFGFIDIVGLSERVYGVQTTSLGQMSTRRNKITQEAPVAAREWLRAGGIIEIHGWARYQWQFQNGEWSTAYRWKSKIETVKMEDLE